MFTQDNYSVTVEGEVNPISTAMGHITPQLNISNLLLLSSSQQCPDRSIEVRWKSVIFVLPNAVKGIGLECKARVLSGTCIVRTLRNRVI